VTRDSEAAIQNMRVFIVIIISYHKHDLYTT